MCCGIGTRVAGPVVAHGHGQPARSEAHRAGRSEEEFFAAARSGDVGALRAALEAGMDVHSPPHRTGASCATYSSVASVPPSRAGVPREREPNGAQMKT